MSTVQQKELTLLLAVVTKYADTLLMAASASGGDFARVEEAVGDFILRLRPALVESGLRVCSASCSRDYSCPECVCPLYRWDSRERMVTTSEGEGRYESVRYRCSRCGKSYYPLEEGNGLTGSHFTTGAKARIGREAADMPYSSASERLKERGLYVSPKEVDRITGEVSSWRQEEERAAVASTFPEVIGLEGETPSPLSGSDPHIPPALFDWSSWKKEEAALISVDGAAVRSPEKDGTGLIWFEGRSAIIAPVAEDSRAKTQYVSGIHTPDALFDRLYAGLQPNGNPKRMTVFVADGATWIWERARLYFTDAVQVLDIYHAGEHVASAGIHCFGEGTAEAKRWREKAREMLLEEERARGVLRALAEQLRSPEKLADADKARTEFRYFWKNRHRMRYQWLKKQGLPIGSGAMESAIKQLSTKRLRQPGMKWSKRGANDMLSLRAAHVSGELPNTVRRKNNSLHALAARFTRPILQLAA